MAEAQDLINGALAFISQPSNSQTGILPAGTGEDSTTLTSLAQYLIWLNEGQNRLARLCNPIYDTASVTPGAAGQTNLGPYSTIVSATSRTMHSLINISIGSNPPIGQTNLGLLTFPYDFFPPDTSGNPTAYVDTKTEILLGAYTTTPTFTLEGFFLPEALTTGTQTIDTAFDDFAQRTIYMYLGWMICQKNIDNSLLAERTMMCANEFVGGCKELYDRLIETDQTAAGFFPPEPITAMVQLVKTGNLKT